MNGAREWQGAADELAHSGIELSVYYPGSIKTPGFAEYLESMPVVTHKIEGQCSDICTASDAAKDLLAGVECGTREITNEFLPSLLVDAPTGCFPLDALIKLVVALIQCGWAAYIRFMCRHYIDQPNSRAAAGGKAAGGKGAGGKGATTRKEPSARTGVRSSPRVRARKSE